MNNQTIQKAAEQLAAFKIKDSFVFQTLHEYRDELNQFVYWKIRLKQSETNEKWIRPMTLDEKNHFVLGNPKNIHEMPLYRLPEILQNPDQTVWITEGEWCADHLANLELLVTTSGSAESTTKTNWKILANRHVIIWRDNDEAGLRYANHVTSELKKLNCNIQWLDIDQLHLPRKGDCVDWLNQNPNATKHDIELLPLVNAPEQIQNLSEKQKHQVITDVHPACAFICNDNGIWYNDNENLQWISSKLEIKALVRDKHSKNWGRLLEFFDADKQLHTWAMPMEMLGSRGDELRYQLLRQGLEISPHNKMRNLLVEYITLTKPEARARCVGQTGWHEQVFVLPDQTIGETKEQVIYQSENLSCDYQQAGTLAQWQEHIAKLCVGNSRLILAVSMAFAAMLLSPAGVESGGVHLVGASSSGKTTILRVAASVYGAPNYLHRWRATTNGLEAVAAARSDTLLILDELAQVESNEAGEIAYMLANGSGKVRAAKNGSARSLQTWRLLFLSAGEIGLAQHMREAGKKARAGQEVRLVDLAADAETGLGVFETLHQYSSAAEFSRTLLEATQWYYGTAAFVFLEKITQSNIYNLLTTKFKNFSQQFIKDYLPENASGQAHRVCGRFALIAFAGELASELGITGWETNEAVNAIAKCFNAWLEHRGGAKDQERGNVLSQVKSFLETHGESRFSDWNAISSHTINRAGFKKTNPDGTAFYILPEAFKQEVCAGLDAKAATQILLSENWLLADNDGKPYRREHLPAIGRSRCYVLTQKVWEH